jgi:hypothetical protein
MAFRKMHSELMNCPVNYDKEEEIEKEMTKQNQRGTKMGTKTTTKQVVSMSPQACVRHKRLKTITKDRRSGSWKSQTDLASTNVTTKERKRVEIRAENSLLFSCLAIHCHVLSINELMSSLQNTRNIEFWQAPNS